MYLELADNGVTMPPYLGEKPLPQDMYEHMLQVPDGKGGFVWVREDLLDDLPDHVIYQLMQMQPHMSGIRDWFQRMRERRQERVASRREYRTQRATQRQGFLTNLVSGITGGDQQQTRDMFPQITGGANIGVSQWWQNPMVIGGIIIGGGLLVYLATRKK